MFDKKREKDNVLANAFQRQALRRNVEVEERGVGLRLHLQEGARAAVDLPRANRAGRGRQEERPETVGRLLALRHGEGGGERRQLRHPHHAPATGGPDVAGVSGPVRRKDLYQGVSWARRARRARRGWCATPDAPMGPQPRPGTPHWIPFISTSTCGIQAQKGGGRQSGTAAPCRSVPLPAARGRKTRTWYV